MKKTLTGTLIIVVALAFVYKYNPPIGIIHEESPEVILTKVPTDYDELWKFEIKAKSDELVISDMTANRGNCVRQWLLFPVSVKFGNTVDVYVRCYAPIEATITTKSGSTWTYTWSLK